MSVTECNDQPLDSFNKDNDIYGIEKGKRTESYKGVEAEIRR